MQTGTMRLRELTVRYSVRKDGEGQPVVVGRDTSNPRETAASLMTMLQDEPSEVFAILCVTTKYRVIAYHEFSRGTLDATLVHPREVFKVALLANAAAIILAHSVARNIMRLMCRRSLCGRGQWKPPITPVDTLIAGT
jgi:DNA repair protein RadC